MFDLRFHYLYSDIKAILSGTRKKGIALVSDYPSIEKRGYQTA